MAGRPRIDPNDDTTSLTLKLPKASSDQIRAAAAKRGMSVAAYVRWAIVTARLHEHLCDDRKAS